jgi:hypothetical protein
VGEQGLSPIDGEAGSSVELFTHISNPIGLCKIPLKFCVHRLSEYDDLFLSNSPLTFVTVIFGCRVAVFLALAVVALG